MAIVGIFDDKFNLPSSLRYFIQIIISYFILNESNLNFFIEDNFSDYYSVGLKIFTIVCITAIINFVNFMDGIDGLISGSFSILIGYLIFNGNNYLLPLFSALVAFLIFNWYPSKIFMGDTGSTFLGAFLAFELCNTNSLIETTNLFFISLPILIDPFTCVLRRCWAKQNIFTSHKLHIYQRLYQAGLSHSKVSLIYIFLIFLLIFSLSFESFLIKFIFALIVMLTMIYLDQKVAIKFHKAKNL